MCASKFPYPEWKLRGTTTGEATRMPFSLLSSGASRFSSPVLSVPMFKCLMKSKVWIKFKSLWTMIFWKRLNVELKPGHDWKECWRSTVMALTLLGSKCWSITSETVRIKHKGWWLGITESDVIGATEARGSSSRIFFVRRRQEAGAQAQARIARATKAFILSNEIWCFKEALILSIYSALKIQKILINVVIILFW